MALERTEVEALYREHGAMVLRRARALLGSEALAQEALHEVFIRVIRAGDSFRADADPSTWLYRITTNYCFNQLRDRRTRQRWLMGEAKRRDRASAMQDPRSEKLLLLRQVLALSSEREASAAIYAFVDEMTYDEIAPLLGVSRRTVGNILQRFVERARELLGDQLSLEGVTT
jgi:RNA polymerase sigma factor (sigma-70 family)